LIADAAAQALAGAAGASLGPVIAVSSTPPVAAPALAGALSPSAVVATVAGYAGALEQYVAQSSTACSTQIGFQLY
jgi:hypothetical protein